MSVERKQQTISRNAHTHQQPLQEMRVVSMAVNLPGPLVAAELRDLGAAVTKIEPLSGDPLAQFAPAFYEALRQGQEIISLDLKSKDGKSELDALLSECDLLLTSSRPAALARLALSWKELNRRHPRLSQVAIVGFPTPQENIAGHDLTYQARHGLLNPPNLPRALVADMGGAQQAVSAALGLMLARERGLGSGYAEVSLASVAEHFSQPIRYGLTSDTGMLGGAFAGYNLYETRDGWIAVAALEPHFWARLQSELGIDDPTYEMFRKTFVQKAAEEWETWARERDLPIVALSESAPHFSS